MEISRKQGRRQGKQRDNVAGRNRIIGQVAARQNKKLCNHETAVAKSIRLLGIDLAHQSDW